MGFTENDIGILPPFQGLWVVGGRVPGAHAPGQILPSLRDCLDGHGTEPR
jgi:hypothetical protein